MKKNVFITLFSLILIFSCEEPNLNEEAELELNNTFQKNASSDIYELQKKFAIALHITIPLNLKWYGLRRYTTGDVSFSMIPLKVQ